MFLNSCVFNLDLTRRIGSFLNYLEITTFKYTTKNIYSFLNDNQFMRDYYLKIMKYYDFSNPRKIDYEFDIFKKQIYDPRLEIIKKLENRASYYWYAENRNCMKCGRKSYPVKLSRRRLNRLLRLNSPICFCELTVTNTIMANEEIRIENDIKNLVLEKKELEKKIQKKKEQLKNHKTTINLSKFKNYLNKKVNTLKHGRQRNQCKKMINSLNYDNIERYNPQYNWLLELRNNNNNNNNIINA